MFTNVNEIDAALCLWEYALLRRGENDDSVYDWLRGGEGSATARHKCIDLAVACENSFRVAQTRGYDDPFDWEFVPRWMELAMEITKTHDLSGDWFLYMGLNILREYEIDQRLVYRD